MLLDYNVAPPEQGRIKARLADLRMRMPLYRAGRIAADRKLFEFAKNIGIETIVGVADPKLLPELDKLANEFGVNIALDHNPKTGMAALAGLSKRIGMNADPR